MEKPTRRHQGGRHPCCPSGHVLRMDGKRKRKKETGGWDCDKCGKLGSKAVEAWRCCKRQVGTGLDGACDYDICGPCMEIMLVEGVPDGEEGELEEDTEEEE
eukprot:TRINITY_DN72739_c0_g1_i1.p1 TRINITY_DN72739_c0_g1~~TRINITY_DN72739_c0_g1_i1.p1  ORF type:complete len:102 (-),score=30.19 TRINITY_DN72739_c0_g1_i1:3-308(-)